MGGLRAWGKRGTQGIKSTHKANPDAYVGEGCQAAVAIQEQAFRQFYGGE
jgi:hypothetical protein